MKLQFLVSGNSKFVLDNFLIKYYNIEDYDDLLLEGGEVVMSEVKVGKNENFENALKRFKRQCARAGVLAELRKREHYEKPSVKRKKKSEAARKVARKKKSF